MTEKDLIALLCEFFMDQFREDAIGVGDWLIQGDNDVDETVSAIEALRNRS